MSSRIRGQETQVRIILAGALQKELDEVKSFELTFATQIQTEQFLGRTTTEKDEIFMGLKGAIEFQPRSLQFLDLLQAIVDRATRRVKESDTLINISTKLIFPNGDQPRITVLDAKFQDPGFKIPGREQFVTVPLTWEASSHKYSPG